MDKFYERLKMLDNETLQNAKDKKFTDFSNAVKQELRSKLASNSVTKDYTSEYDRLQQMKDVFSQITKD